MLNVLKSLTESLLRHEEKLEESCDIPNESITDWLAQVDEEIQALSSDPEKHQIALEQLNSIHQHLEKVLAVRASKCN